MGGNWLVHHTGWDCWLTSIRRLRIPINTLVAGTVYWRPDCTL